MLIYKTKVGWTQHRYWIKILRSPTPDGFAFIDIEANISPSTFILGASNPRRKNLKCSQIFTPSLYKAPSTYYSIIVC